MTYVQTQYKETYARRTMSKSLLRALVEALAEFKPGLPTTSRKITARAVGMGGTTEREGPESWKVTDPHALAELMQVRVVLVLASTERRTCEVHVEFRIGHVVLTVLDAQTGWGKSVFEETRILLKKLKISSSGLAELLRKAYGLLDIFQNMLLALSASLFAIWLATGGTAYLFALLAMFVAGIMPALSRSFDFLSPPRRAPIFQETVARTRNFPWTEATAVLAFITGVLQLVKALLGIVW